jgi:hypothetical protein
MMHRHTTTTLRPLLLLGAALALACTMETEDASDEPGSEFRDGGCGAGRTPGTGNQKCTYKLKIKPDSGTTPKWRATGYCQPGDSDHLHCVYEAKKATTAGTWCEWSPTSIAEGCAAPSPGQAYPQCTDYPQRADLTTDASGTIDFKTVIAATLDLQAGSTLCDPAAPQADLDIYCQYYPPQSVEDELYALCTGFEPETKTKQINCCVAKDQPCDAIDEESDLDVELAPECDVVDESPV